MDRFDNRFRGKAARFAYLPAWARSSRAGVRFDRVVINPTIGEEVIATLVEPTDSVHELLAKKPLELRVKTGVAQTSAGPVLFLLWWVPPITHGMPSVLYEHLLNAGNPQTVELLKRVSHQTHLHLAVLGPKGRLFDLIEFENTFEFEKLIPVAEAGCSCNRDCDFAAARREYEANYKLAELFAMEPERE